MLVDDTEPLPALIFEELVAEQGICRLSAVEVDELLQMPDPWLLHGETPLRAQMRLLSGRPDVTAWTSGDGKLLAAKLKEIGEQPPGFHRKTLLGLGDDVDEQPPTVAVTGAATPVTVSAEGDEGPPNL
jgi:hypothetical protein